MEKQKIYRAIQATHIHGSPDGPWFFIIARNLARQRQFQLMGITDTAMLRPQVFAFCDGEVQVGLIASEKQAIDATLMSLSKDDKRICPVADRYWNARGGSYDDGGAFIFNLKRDPAGKIRITCTDKFGTQVPMPGGTESCDFSKRIFSILRIEGDDTDNNQREIVPGNSVAIFEMIRDLIPEWTFDEIDLACRQIINQAKDASKTATAIEVLTLLNDRRYSTGAKRRSHVLHIVRTELNALFSSLPKISDKDAAKGAYRLVDFESRGTPAGAARHGNHAGDRRRPFSTRRRRLRRRAAG